MFQARGTPAHLGTPVARNKEQILTHTYTTYTRARADLLHAERSDSPAIEQIVPQLASRHTHNGLQRSGGIGGIGGIGVIDVERAGATASYCRIGLRGAMGNPQ